jgi:NitT/TauT family transport system substrate-binding protein
MRDVLGPTQSLMTVARASYLEQNRAALQDFFEDYLRGLRWFLDPANRDEAVGIVAQFNRQPVAVFADYLFTNDDYYRDRDGNPNLDALQNNLRVLREVGFLDIDIDATRHADLSFIAEARRRLK